MTQQQPPRKRKRIITNNNNNMIKNSLKIGVACSMAMCLFTEDGTTTAFVFDHVSHVHNNILLMKFTNWFFTLTIFTMFLFSYIVINFELKKCKEKTTKFLLPLFTTSNTTSKTRSKTSCSNNNNYNERKGVRIRRDEEDNKVFTYGKLLNASPYACRDAGDAFYAPVTHFTFENPEYIFYIWKTARRVA